MKKVVLFSVKKKKLESEIFKVAILKDNSKVEIKKSRIRKVSYNIWCFDKSSKRTRKDETSIDKKSRRRRWNKRYISLKFKV